MSDFAIDKKTDVSISFQYYESDGTTPRALTGATLLFTVKANPYDSDSDDSEALLSVSQASHTDAAAGESTINLTDDQADLTPGTYFYDIKVKENDSKIYLAQSGRLTVNATVTNRTT